MFDIWCIRSDVARVVKLKQNTCAGKLSRRNTAVPMDPSTTATSNKLSIRKFPFSWK